MPHLSTRISDLEARQIAAIAKARGVKGRSVVVRALVAEEHARLEESGGPPDVASTDELKKLLTMKAREGNVAAMKELRVLLERPPDPPAPDPQKPAERDEPGPGATVTPLAAIRQRASGG